MTKSIKIDFDVRVINDEDFVPFEQVMDLIRSLDEHAPNVDLAMIAKNLERQRDTARSQM